MDIELTRMTNIDTYADSSVVVVVKKRKVSSMCVGETMARKKG